MHVVDIVIAVVWVAFWLYWIAASLGAKAGRTRWTQFAGVRVAIKRSTKNADPFHF